MKSYFADKTVFHVIILRIHAQQTNMNLFSWKFLGLLNVCVLEIVSFQERSDFREI